MKKIVIFGGGSGLSQILKGLKLFPVEITAVVSVSDNGASTGRLRKDLHIPAVGDISKVMLSMSNANQDIIKLMNYRFTKSRTLGNHSIKNLLLSALLDMKGNFNDAIPIMMDLLDIDGTILPLTEDNANLVTYDKEITINPKVLNAVKEADLIIFSSGSLLTSITPHLINKTLNKAIKSSLAKKLYICNIFTQPGETDNFKVSDHIKWLEKYLGKNVINIVLANNQKLDSNLVNIYQTQEQKDPVILDINTLNTMNIEVISDNLAKVENDVYRHDALKTAYLIFSYLMDHEK